MNIISLYIYIQKRYSSIQTCILSSYRLLLVSILSFLHPELKTSLFSYGELFGKIINSPRGKGGFGYDPIFQIKNSKLTLAEISEEKRMKISHRTISTLKMINLLNESKM